LIRTEHETKGLIPPGTSGAAAVVIDRTMYVFAGHTRRGNTNSLYSLDLTTLTWTNHTPECVELQAHGKLAEQAHGKLGEHEHVDRATSRWPSPRDKFAFWSYKHRLVFWQLITQIFLIDIYFSFDAITELTVTIIQFGIRSWYAVQWQISLTRWQKVGLKQEKTLTKLYLLYFFYIFDHLKILFFLLIE